MKKLLILSLLFFGLVLITNVNADWLANGNCERSTTCTISRQVVNDTTGIPIPNYFNTSCNITIYSNVNFSARLTDNAPMTNQTNGYFIYDVRQDNNGFYPATMLCNYMTASDVADVSFTVIDREADKKLITLPILYILLIAGWGGLIFGYIKVQKGFNGMQYLMLLGCFLIAIAGLVILRQGIDNTIDWTTEAFGLLNIAVGLIFIGYFVIEQLEIEI